MVIFRILARIKEHGVLVGYAAVDKQNNKHFILKQNIGQYKYINAYVNRNNELIAKHGFTIRTINKEDEAEIKRRRTPNIGKPALLVASAYGELSLKQKNLLEQFKGSSIIRINKKISNIKVTMNDMACLTAVTRFEYALFERNDKYIIVQGTKYNIELSRELVAEIVNNKYTWVGHTHPGYDIICTMPSDDDYTVLKMLGQKQSVIYNSIGHAHTFGIE